jgi:hypothetical protein
MRTGAPDVPYAEKGSQKGRVKVKARVRAQKSTSLFRGFIMASETHVHKSQHGPIVPCSFGPDMNLWCKDIPQGDIFPTNARVP